MLSSEHLLLGSEYYPPLSLLDSVDLYVGISGSDAHGNGTSDNPFFSLERAHKALFNYRPTPSATINVYIQEGIYNVDTFRPNYPFGSNVAWTGAYEDFGAGQISLSNYSSVTSAPAEATELQYYDIDCTFPTDTEAAVGQFVLILQPSGGTNNPATRGLHKIIAWDSGTFTATVRVWQVNGVAEQASGTITASGSIIKTVFKSTGNMLEIIGAISGGTWNGLVFEGTGTAEYAVSRGIELKLGGNMSGGTRLGMHNYQVGARTSVGSSLLGQGISASKCKVDGMLANQGMIDNVGGGIINGCGTAGVGCNTGFLRHRSYIHSSGSVAAVLVGNNGTIDVVSSTIHYDTGSSVALRAREHSTIVSNGSTISGFTTNRDPSSNPGSEGSYILP